MRCAILVGWRTRLSASLPRRPNNMSESLNSLRLLSLATRATVSTKDSFREQLRRRRANSFVQLGYEFMSRIRDQRLHVRLSVSVACELHPAAHRSEFAFRVGMRTRRR